MGRRILILDTTLRDGEQAPGCSMNFHEKLEMAGQLERLGVDIIEAGFPVASPDDFRAVEAVARQVKDCQVAALCRCVARDVERTWQAIRDAAAPRLHLVLATSPVHMQYKLRMTPQQVLDCAVEMVRLARGLCPDVEFSAEDASRSDPAFLAQVCAAAAQAGASTINLPDTVGYSTPQELGALVAQLRQKLPEQVVLSVHNHNDLGMAVANTLASIQAGAGQVECTINGIGERAGNASLEEVVMALHTRKDYFGCETGIRIRQIYRTSKLLSTITGAEIPSNKPVVGGNAFAHESGIHQHGVLAERSTYEIMRPEEIGIYRSKMILGKHSGKHAFQERIEELGYRLEGEDLEEAFSRFKDLADRKKEITDRDVEALIRSTAVADLREAYKLESFVVNSGTVISATAVVKLVREDGQVLEQVSRGEGPIDAAFNAIDRIVKMDSHLENWSMQAVTEGEDALGEAVSKITCNGHRITGRGLSTDILEASIRSYLNAINKAIAIERRDSLETQRLRALRP
ncbi:MAG TPA: 2-isopropylmalate synthase [Candidatus Anaerotruncus excrementipullorum]|uniref:2-isopropylmalate synthase n=1 Tax=Candidatus Anaerotruncus excrementipullorum TaxID=2838465 RepID=A0A9D1WPZ0_9FIRM|nr:2-isopropylmalate synthase [Candidatus Anaerotruncus excrementipullorum]